MPEPHRHVYERPEWPDEPVGGWWGSVTDDEHHFVGVIILTGFEDREFVEVATELNRILPGEGGQIVCVRYPLSALDEIDEADRNRLLSKDDLARIGENTESVGELGIEL